ncbi:MAG: primosomal protein N' [candidate division WOR-3 bacterium]
MAERWMFADVVVPRTPLDELTYRFAPEELGELHPGDIVQVPLRRKTVTGAVLRVRADAAISAKEIQPVIDIVARQFITPDLLQLLRWTADYYVCHLGEVLELILPQIVSGKVETVNSEIGAAENGSNTLPPELEQAFTAGNFGVWVTAQRSEFEKLLFDFIRRAFSNGSVIILMPEADRVEFLSQLQRVWGERVIEYHHQMGKKQQRAAWQAIVSNNNVVVGMRSAVWVPVRRLSGVILINENANSFKEERVPCYHARDVAVARARFASCPVLVFASPPSVETWWNLRRGKYHLLDRVNFRIDRTNVFVVDMRQHRRELVSPLALRDLRNALKQQQIALCYINRRGLSRYVECADCGTVLKCSRCQSPYVLSGAGRVRCRVCGEENEAPERCAVCQGMNFNYRAPGVDMVVRELKRLGIECQSVTGGVQNLQLAAADAGATGFAPVLVGTRTVLRSDRLRVPGLVVFLNFDTEFTIPDFRSRERAFSLLVSLLSRKPSRLIIQTTRPEDSLLEFALQGKVSRFLDQELKLRAEAGFPPYKRLVAVEFSGEERTVLNWVNETVSELGVVPGVELLGPVKRLQPRQGKPQFRLIVKLPTNLMPAKVIDREKLKHPRIRVRIDVDPQEML